MQIYLFQVSVLKPASMPSYGFADSFLNIRIQVPAFTISQAKEILSEILIDDLSKHVVFLSHD